jgi:hypothetical protein
MIAPLPPWQEEEEVMRRLSVLFVVVCLALGGCQFPVYIVNNLSYEVCRCLDDSKNKQDIAKLAEQNWKRTVCGSNEHEPHSEDYHAGFIEGFSYFVFRGGDGEPPPVPPQCYWKESFRTPEGQVRVQNWFNGFRVGAQTAREGNYRSLELLPLSRPLQNEQLETNRPHEPIDDALRN